MTARAYKHYLLVILMLSLAFNHLDRFALGLVMQNIKHEFRLSDTQLGLLSGLAFALFYSTMGIPIARWVDRGNRVRIIALTATTWSLMVALCGTATNFAQLLLYRIGVSVGEAGCVPPAHSLIPDYFTRAERPRATSIYALGAGLGGTFGYFLAGWLNQFYGWRVMFMVLSLPGFALAALVMLTLKEPRRQAAGSGAGAAERREAQPPQQPHPSLRTVCATLWGNATFKHLLVCLSLMFFFSSGIGQWQPTFFIRSFGVTTGTLGTSLSAISLVGMVGIYFGGELASRYAANDESAQLRGMAAAYLIFGFIGAGTYIAPNYYMAFAMMGIATVGSNLVNGPLFSTIQTLIPPSMRAVSIAVVFLFANLFGLGLGPLAAGALSDVMRQFFGEESLRYSLLALSPGYFLVAWYFWQASLTAPRDLAALKSGVAPVGGTEIQLIEA